MRPLVLVPTFDEAACLPDLLAGIQRYQPGCAVVVVDDASTDGTADVALGRGVRVIQRAGARSYARACEVGMRHFLAGPWTHLVQMDADGSHDPADIRRLLGEDADLVIGSRHLPGAASPGRPLARRALSVGATAWVRVWSGIPLTDATAGFRAWSRRAVRAAVARPATTRGYAFNVEMALRAWRAGVALAEVPVVFRPRRAGESKMSARIALEAALFVPGSTR